MAMTAVGTTMAMLGQTTWTAPADKKERDLFYATGRKPFSIMVGDKWIPAWWMGPAAMAFLLPTAFKYYTADQRNALKEGAVEKTVDILAGTAHFIGSQSSVQSIGALFDVLGGNQDPSFNRVMATSAEQFIPLSGLLRNAAKVLDPVFHKPDGFWQSVESTIPGLSQDVPVLHAPHGEVSARIPWNGAMPFEIGQENPAYEAQYAATGKAQQLKALNSDFRAKARQPGGVTADDIKAYQEKVRGSL
jgi:hypothetical protein